MTLLTLLSGLVPAALLFVLAGRLTAGRPLGRPETMGLLGEAIWLTLVAGLWFASLGSGGWLLLFFLLGLLAATATWGCHPAFLRSDPTGRVLAFVLTVARYVVAGAVLAWRLG